MPVCLINGCTFTPGRYRNGHEIKLHTFPNSLQRIKDWLLQMGQIFHDVDNIAQQILDSKLKKSNKFRLCSLHFTDDSFIVNAGGRILRPNALPTIFQSLPHSSEMIHEDLSLRKTFKRKREQKRSSQASSLYVVSPQNPSPQNLSPQNPSPQNLLPQNSPLQNLSPQNPPSPIASQIIEVKIKTEDPDDFPLYATSTEGSIESYGAANETETTKTHQDAETQTEFTFKNSIIYLLDNDFLTSNTAIDPCGPPYFSLQNPIVALNCSFIPALGRPS
ncbi:uncharacterized protein RB166_000204 [Leptodactylus fuscus]|uniref:uncharacterized protein LOC142193165 n=1 Tax=Leptodactylus fuscus TaxID=238119 RepID=UPI003F4E9CBE